VIGRDESVFGGQDEDVNVVWEGRFSLTAFDDLEGDAGVDVLRGQGARAARGHEAEELLGRVGRYVVLPVGAAEY
jgi:hypothetical protein